MYKNIDFKKINGSNLQNKNNLQSDDFYNFFFSPKIRWSYQKLYRGTLYTQSDIKKNQINYLLYNYLILS